MNAVEIDSARLTFGRVTALGDFSCAIPPGSVTVLLGPNGAGKTTALRVITGALRLDSGEVRVFGLDPVANGAEVRLRCGVVSAQPALYGRLSGRDNLRYSAELFGASLDAVEPSAARFGIDYALDTKVATYSTGMKTRLALARAVLHEPELLLLDEPTSGLDPESGQAVLRLIREYAAGGRTVVMCTHLLAEAEGLADQVVILDDGRDLITGAPDELVGRFWPTPSVLMDAADRAALSVIAGLDGVVSVDLNGGPATVAIDDIDRVPELVATLSKRGVRLTKVIPHEPTLEELYFEVRRRERTQ